MRYISFAKRPLAALGSKFIMPADDIIGVEQFGIKLDVTIIKYRASSNIATAAVLTATLQFVKADGTDENWTDADAQINNVIAAIEATGTTRSTVAVNMETAGVTGIFLDSIAYTIAAPGTVS